VGDAKIGVAMTAAISMIAAIKEGIYGSKAPCDLQAVGT
jgi:hypothetical protein